MPKKRNLLLVFPFTVLLALLGLTASAQDSEPTATPIPTVTPITSETLQNANYLVPEIISVREHDPGSFTQGLHLHEGSFYESAGENGESNVREVNPETGEVIRQFRLNEAYFAEGLALVEDRLIQLTWTSQIALFYDRDTFQVLGLYFYEGQGWGLCYDGEYLWMSNGSAQLQRRDPNSFKLLDTLDVTLEGEPQDQLNELECVGDTIYANVWQTNYIMQIEKSTGNIISVIDAENLVNQLPEEERASFRPGRQVLNGIAYDSENDVFYLTGKYWSKLFEVRFVPAG